MATIGHTTISDASAEPLATMASLADELESALKQEHRAHGRLMRALAKAQREGDRQRRELAR